MSEEIKEFAELEQELAALRPASPANRDTLMFEAGRSAARRSVRLWQISSAAMLLVVAGMGGMLLRGTPSPSSSVDHATHQSLPPVTPPELATVSDAALGTPSNNVHFPPGSYLWLRNEILTRGVGALPRPAGGDTSPAKPSTDDLQGTPQWQRRAVL